MVVSRGSRLAMVACAATLSACGADSDASTPAPPQGGGDPGGGGGNPGGGGFAPVGGTGGLAGTGPGGSGNVGGGAAGGGGAPIAPGEFDITGTWGVEMIPSAIVLGNTLSSKQYYLVEITQTGTTVEYSTVICDYELPALPGVAAIVVPPPLQQIIQTKAVTATGPFLSGTQNGASYNPGPQYIVLGANLANVATDPLPTQVNLAGSFDEDGDGNPGVSVNVETSTAVGQVYAALRIFAELSGVVHDSNTILGTANGDAEQSVLGFSDPVLAVADQVVIDILPNAPFAQRRIDGQNGTPDLDSDGNGTITCDELNTLRRVVFPD